MHTDTFSGIADRRLSPAEIGAYLSDVVSGQLRSCSTDLLVQFHQRLQALKRSAENRSDLQEPLQRCRAALESDLHRRLDKAKKDLETRNVDQQARIHAEMIALRPILVELDGDALKGLWNHCWTRSGGSRCKRFPLDGNHR